MVEEAQVVNINGTEYNEADLTEQHKYFIAQIKNLQSKSKSLKFQLDQVQVSLNAFTNSLISELEKSSEKQED